jgi:anaerobic ribonucleoside-triphosphate reductase activating protein
MTTASVQVAQRIAGTEAEGPGLRYALWVQGCPLRCPGCCNPEMIPAGGGEPLPVQTLLAEIRATPGLDGVTLLGGEPFAQAVPLAELAEGVRAMGLSVIAFSGWTRDELEGVSEARALLAGVDVLVDGRFEVREPPSADRNVGSPNQRVLPLTARGARLVARWNEGPEVVEVRVAPGGEMAVANGPPGSLPVR